MSKEKLKPCPFEKCGEKENIVLDRYRSGNWNVHCMMCGCSGPNRKNETDAVTCWNKRAGIAELESQLATYRWIPVSERLPEEKEKVLMATSYGLVTTVKYQDGLYVRLLGCRRCAGMSLGSVTHWMPIPPLPEGAKT